MDPYSNTTTASDPYRKPEPQNRYNPGKQEPQWKSAQCHCQINPAIEHPEERVVWLQNLATAIRQIKKHRDFREISPTDSIKIISKKLHFIFNEIRRLTQDADILTASLWMDIWEVIAKFMAEGPAKTEEERADAKRELFNILRDTTEKEPFDLTGWLSTRVSRMEAPIAVQKSE